jgi:hypothetical protein
MGTSHSFQSRRGSSDLRLGSHKSGAPQHPGGAEELIGRGRLWLRYEGLELIQTLAGF